MPVNIPPMKHKVPMPGANKDNDGLEKYYDYKVEDELEIKKELIHKEKEKILTVLVIVAAVSVVSSLITGVLSAYSNSKPLLIIFIVLITIATVSTIIADAIS